MTLAQEYGAAVICLAIDEEGQARDADWKLRVCKRIYDIAIERYGIDPTDLIFDMLTFPLGSGQEDLRKDAMETIEAIRRVKAELPGASTILGLSNVQLRAEPRDPPRAEQRVPARVPRGRPRRRDRARGADHADAQDRRQGSASSRSTSSTTAAATATTRSPSSWRYFDGVEVGTVEREDRSGWPVEDRLKQRIIDGEREGLDPELDEAMTAGARRSRSSTTCCSRA